jgi:hypothetical protein
MEACLPRVYNDRVKNATVLGLLIMIAITAGCSGSSAPATPVPPRWQLYQRALADVLLGPPGRTVPDLSQDRGLCEWVILGQQGNDVYVWAVCQVEASSSGAATSAPAVIRLAGDGGLSEVVMPEEGWGNIDALFPEGLLDGIYDSATAGLPDAMRHIDLRRGDPSIPPQIVLDGVQLP